MVMIGVFLAIFAIVGVFALWQGYFKSEDHPTFKKWFFRIGIISLPLPLISNELGWITAEAGRQPWIIQGVLRTADAASAAPSEQIILSLVVFICTYIVLFIAWILVMRRIIQEGPRIDEKSEVLT
jgi:cytochrome d ubiquinol oxidase subunit I